MSLFFLPTELKSLPKNQNLFQQVHSLFEYMGTTILQLTLETMKVFQELPNDVIYYILNLLNHQDRTAVLVAFSDEFSIREPLWKRYYTTSLL